ncbi:MAG: precorrin-3B synthase [Hyphomicrobium sp.]
MSARAELRKGWCPGALRPMETGDGLLIRVRPRAGLFLIPALRVIAQVALRCGSGEIDLTNRANLQVRGASESSWRGALAALDEAGLIDDIAGAEAVRNVIVDPLFGLDGDRADLRPLAAELERRLACSTALHALPGKFGFSFSDARADIMIAAHRGNACALALDGDDMRIAVVPSKDVVEAAVRLAHTFLKVQTEISGVRRMRDGVAALGADGMFANAGLTPSAHIERRTVQSASLIGAIGTVDAPTAAGVGLPFGRTNSRQLAALCDWADDAGCRDARPSPTRVLIFPVASRVAAASLLDRARAMGLIARADDQRLAMEVCPGAPACRNATTETRVDALRVATALGDFAGRSPSVHISGCEKSCARRGAADLTFIARDGRYDLVRDGGVEDAVTLASIAPAELGDVIARTLAERRP